MFSKFDSAGEMSEARGAPTRAIPYQRLAAQFPFFETKPAAWGVLVDTIGEAGGVGSPFQ